VEVLLRRAAIIAKSGPDDAGRRAHDAAMPRQMPASVARSILPFVDIAPKESSAPMSETGAFFTLGPE
jgi:hypothetical protein